MSSDALPCDDFLQSARLLNLWRKSDDHVRYELNSELPTASFVSKVDYASKCNTFVNKVSATVTFVNMKDAYES
ncbi:unnamed protein product [Schistosoma bovis]|nr:unnamed protein product [Schistosoma bovis]